MFVPASARVLDTRNGTGGYNGSLSANAWHAVQVTGVGDVPSTNVSAVSVMITVIGPSTGGNVYTASSACTGAPVVNSLIYDPAMGTTNVSGSAMTAVGSDGKINVRTTTDASVVVDVEGYFTAGDGTAAPGGFIPLAGARFVDTRNGTGLPSGKKAAGSSATITVGGLNGVPANAMAVSATVSVLNSSGTGAGYLTTGSDSTSLSTPFNYQAGINTSIGANIPLSDTGTFLLSVIAGPAVDVVVDVTGYYTAVAGTTGAFTPGAARVYDKRSASIMLAGNSVNTIPVAGIAGVPAAGAGISALAINIQSVKPAGGTAAGYLRLWPDDRSEPGVTQLNYPITNGYRSSLAIVQVGADGAIKLRVAGADALYVVLDVEGWYSNVLSPISNGQTITGRYATLQAGASGGSWVTYKYRSGLTASFANVPVANVVVPGTSTHPSAWPVTKTAGAFSAYTWDVPGTVGLSDQLVQVEACYGTSSIDPSPACSMPANVQLGVDGFQNAYATSDVGPGTVSELTGDYSVDATDADVSAYLGDLSVGRSLTTLSPTGEQAGPAGVFGPSWTASLNGPSLGDADFSVTDKSTQGVLNFTAADGSVKTYEATTPTVPIRPALSVSAMRLLTRQRSSWCQSVPSP